MSSIAIVSQKKQSQVRNRRSERTCNSVRPREPGHGVPMGPHGSPWVPMCPHGSPWASMENPRMSEIMDFNETHYSVRQKVGSTGSISMQNMFPLHPVTSKRPESPYGAKCFFWPKIQFFSFSAYKTPIGPLQDPYRTPMGLLGVVFFCL